MAAGSVKGKAQTMGAGGDHYVVPKEASYTVFLHHACDIVLDMQTKGRIIEIASRRSII
jgi:hypothetical protein